MKTEINQLLRDKNLDAIIISGSGTNNPPLAYFLKGAFFTRAHLFILKDQDPVLFYRPMERDTAAQTGLSRIISYDTFSSAEFRIAAKGDAILYDALELQALCQSLGLESGRVGFCGKEEIGTQYAVLREFQQLMPAIEIAGSEGIDILREARYTKDSAELERIRQMGEIVTTVVGKVEALIRGGYLQNGILFSQDGQPITIGQIKKYINVLLCEAGVENPEGTIFALGKDAAVPHNAGNDAQALEAGKSIVFDFFPCEAGGGYFFDFTRTWSIGYATEAVQKAYDQVLEVHHAVFDSIQNGQEARDLQKLTCKLFQEMGHPTVADTPGTMDGFVHSVGHGLGLNIHERPFTRDSADNTDRLLPGTVVTIEPGVYYPEIEEPYGIRIEDTIYIDQDGKPQYFVNYPYRLVIEVETKK